MLSSVIFSASYGLEYNTPTIKKKPDGTFEYLLQEEASWYRADLIDIDHPLHAKNQTTQFGNIRTFFTQDPNMESNAKITRLFMFPFSVTNPYSPRELISTKVAEESLGNATQDTITFTDQLTFQPYKHFIKDILPDFSDLKARLSVAGGITEIFDEDHHLYCVASGTTVPKIAPEKFEVFDRDSETFTQEADIPGMSASTGTEKI